jgi:hypothetical protein
MPLCPFPETPSIKSDRQERKEYNREKTGLWREPDRYSHCRLAPHFGFGFCSPTNVGAILLLFFWFPTSSFSLSLASLFLPLTELAALLGVCGGVEIGMLDTKLALPAAIPLGRLPDTRGGLLMIVPGAGVA